VADWIWQHNVRNQGIREEFEWFTNVLVSDNGYEQRHALRGAPRRYLEYRHLTASASDRRKITALLFARQSLGWRVPIWQDSSRLTAAATTGATSLSFDSRWRDFDDDADILLSSRDRQEFVTAVSVGDSSTTVSALASDWPVGTLVTPVRNATLNQDLSGEKIGRDRSEFIVSFELVATERSTRRIGTWSPTTYRGWPTLTRPHDAANDNKFTVKDRRVTIDNKTGVTVLASPETGSRTGRTYQWTAGRLRENIGTMLAWLYSHEGKLNPFWLFNHEPDFAITATIPSAQTYFDFERFEYGTLYADHPARRDVAFWLKNGSFLFRRLTYASNTSTTERCNLSSALGVTVAPADVRTCGFLYPVRLDSDRLSVEWSNNQLASVSAPVRDLLTSV
jgi:hypothetical protein